MTRTPCCNALSCHASPSCSPPLSHWRDCPRPRLQRHRQLHPRPHTLQVVVDGDGDGYGNACDADITGDGIVNFADLAQLERAFCTNDPVADLNAYGVVNFADLAIMKKSFFMKPGPAAGKP